MISNKRFVIPALCILTGLLAVSTANAQSQPCYTLASLQGSYAAIGNYGANVAIALATRNYDGNGNLTGAYIVNEPTAGSATGARTLTTGLQAGTYTVNCNGTGKIYRIVTLADGSKANQVDDFVITKSAMVQNYQLPFPTALVAMTIIDAQEVPSAIVSGGIFLTRTLTRLADVYFPY